MDASPNRAVPLYFSSTVHCHSTFCDGKAAVHEMAEAALSAGVKTLGFSGHAHMPFDPDYNMSTEHTAGYLHAVNAARAEYAGRVDILCGIEWDLCSTAAPGVPGSGLADFDYAIGSTHYILAGDEGPVCGQSVIAAGPGGGLCTSATADADTGLHAFYAVDGAREDFEACIRDVFAGRSLALAAAYYRNVAAVSALLAKAGGDVPGSAAAATQGAAASKAATPKAAAPRILGHFDLVKKLNAGNRYFDEDAPEYRALALAALDAAKAAGCVLEINTGGIYRGWRQDVYPARFILERWRQLGGAVVITADAHETAALLFGFDKAADAARAAGFAEVLVLTKNGFVPCAL